MRDANQMLLMPWCAGGDRTSMYPCVVPIGTYPNGTIFTAFSSDATNFASNPPDTNGKMDVFLQDQVM